MMMNELTDEEIGMRAFQVRKAKAVERASERMRQGLGKDWASLTAAELEELEWLLGEVWKYVARTEWDDLHFGKLTRTEVRNLLHIGREIRTHKRNAVEALNEIAEIVAAKG